MNSGTSPLSGVPASIVEAVKGFALHAGAVLGLAVAQSHARSTISLCKANIEQISRELRLSQVLHALDVAAIVIPIETIPEELKGIDTVGVEQEFDPISTVHADANSNGTYITSTPALEILLQFFRLFFEVRQQTPRVFSTFKAALFLYTPENGGHLLTLDQMPVNGAVEEPGNVSSSWSRSFPIGTFGLIQCDCSTAPGYVSLCS